MERRFKGYVHYLSEMELIYDKADANEGVASLLSEVESLALREAEDRCGMIMQNGKFLTRERFLAMPDPEKEAVIQELGARGFLEYTPSLEEGKIKVTFAPYIPMFLGCTTLALINLLEKLDGSFNLLHPRATLELEVPLGGKKGLMKSELLILQLFPWLTIHETASENVAVFYPVPQEKPSAPPQAKPVENNAPAASPQAKPVEKNAPAAPPQAKPVEKTVAEPPQAKPVEKTVAEPEKRKGFFRKLFGRK